jgi:hypothetical protein
MIGLRAETIQNLCRSLTERYIVSEILSINVILYLYFMLKNDSANTLLGDVNTCFKLFPSHIYKTQFMV